VPLTATRIDADSAMRCFMGVLFILNQVGCTIVQVRELHQMRASLLAFI